MKGRILSSLLVVISLSSMQAQNAPSVPRLVVGVTIDNLRADYIEAFSTLSGEKGFKRLLREGRFYSNAEFNFNNVDKSSGTAAIYTGTTPAVNGIIGDSWFDRNTFTVTGCVDDNNYMGIYTSESTSAEKLRTSTISDELMIATHGQAEVYSIAPSREMAVLMSGHASKGAFWINDETGKWSGTTYYTNFPKWVSTYNDQQGLDFRIDNITWGPYLPVTAYDYLTSDAKQITFKHNFSNDKKNKYRKFKTSPYVNEEVNKLVSNCVNFTSIGRDNIPDLLSIGYYAGNFEHRPIADAPMELQDMYVRLDRNIADLLDIIDRKVGLHNALIFITSTGNSENEPADDVQYRIPSGEFNIKRCSALLNLYLGAIYGEGKYVEADYEQEIFLNQKLIEQKKLDMNEILRKSSEFLAEFSGVRNVYSSERIKLGAWDPTIDKIRNCYNPNISGDLYLEILPGWKIVKEHSLDSRIVRDIYASSPLVFIGWNTKPAIIHTPVKIGNISSTISHSMRIRAPNASNCPPLIDIRKE